MSTIPNELRYTKSHEWVRILPDGHWEIGITDHAQSALGDLVFIELPELGRYLRAGESCAVVESVKAASDIYSPIDGSVVAANPSLAVDPGAANQDPYAAGWLIRIEPSVGGGAQSLLDAAAYADFLAADAR